MNEVSFGKQLQRRHGARPNVRMWRNVSAAAHVGRLVHRAKVSGLYPLAVGDCVLRGGKPIHAGLATGSGDYIGIKRVPVIELPRDGYAGLFTSIELKTENTATEEHQRNWMQMVLNMGGLACIAHAMDEVDAILGIP